MPSEILLPQSQTEKSASKRNTNSKSKSMPKEGFPASQSKSKGKQGLGSQASASILSNVLRQGRDELSTDEEVDDGRGNALAPPGCVRLTDVLDSEEFDWDSLKEDNDDLELVVLRVPERIKPKYLSHLSLSLPTSEATAVQKLASLNRKSGAYDVWSIPHPSPSSSMPDYNEMSGPAVGGEELLSLNVLLPRKKKGGKLYLVLTAQSSLPTPPATPHEDSTGAQDVNANANSDIYKSPARYQHPKHLLKHRFLPTGAGLRDPASSTLTPSIPTTPSTLTGPIENANGENETAVKAAKDERTKAKKVKKMKDARVEGGSPTKKRKAEGEEKKVKKTKLVNFES
ncbi:hypothetical protein A7U60_g1661 [Sanghuangporus baumii]|uniref:Uncharacterized protein n=1 Tax=Sanghuangporus baumii TaxID=108892 RepID=A0A9Q5NBH2_SANBA|nr:hypothetical protein A7U60_g1661 [Sanghuangporus baumii]